MKSIVKKIISVVFAVVFIVSALIFGVKDHSDAADVGVRITTKVPAHGHSGPLDGGVLKPQGLSVYSSGTQTIGQATTIIQFNTILVDTGSFYDAVNYGGLVPVLYNYAEITACVFGVGGSNTLPNDLALYKNGVYTGIDSYIQIYGVSNMRGCLISGLLSVSAGDYFNVKYTNNNATTQTIQGSSFLSIKYYR